MPPSLMHFELSTRLATFGLLTFKNLVFRLWLRLCYIIHQSLA